MSHQVRRQSPVSYLYHRQGRGDVTGHGYRGEDETLPGWDEKLRGAERVGPGAGKHIPERGVRRGPGVEVDTARGERGRSDRLDVPPVATPWREEFGVVGSPVGGGDLRDGDAGDGAD